MAADYEALRRGVGAYRCSRAVVTVEGPVAGEYLQGQLSQDVAPLDLGQSDIALLLEPNGKLSALVRVTRTASDAYALDTDDGFGDVVATRLSRFRLRTKVAIETAEWPCVALRGAGVQDALADVGTEDGPVASVGAGPPWVLPVEWNGTRGVDLLGPGAEGRVPATARECGADAWEALRIEAGIPKMGTELDERTIAAEAGLIERTVSFTKGCYTGQELVARLDARGNRVARRLCGIVASGLASGEAAKLAGAALFAQGAEKPVGQCTSTAWSPGLGASIALAYVHRSVEVPAALRAQLSSDEAGDAIDVEARPLPLTGA